MRARWPWILALFLVALGLLLPADALLDGLAARYNTVRGFRADFGLGLAVLRLALVVDGLLAPALAALLRRHPWKVPTRPAAPLEAFPAGALYGIGLLAALPGLFESFQDDEWRCLEQYVRHGPLVIVSRSYADNHVLYSLLAWPFVAILGLTEIAVRLPALLLTPLTAPLLYRLLRREHPPRAAFLSSLPLVLSPFLVQYAHEGRAYGPLAAVVLGLLLLRRDAFDGLRGRWIGFVVLGVAAVYLHVFAAAAVAGLCAAELAERGRRDRAAAALMAVGGISVLLLAPVLPSYVAYSGVPRTGPQGSLAEALAALWVAPLPAVLALAFLPPLVRGAREDRGPAAAFGATLLLLLACVVSTSAGFAARFFTPALPLGWAVIGRGLASARRAGLGWAVALSALGLVAVAQYYRVGRRDYRGAAREIESRRASGESLAVLFDGRPMTPYLRSPLRVLSEEELRRERPDWLTIVDVNVSSEMGLWLREHYEVAFRRPSVRGELQIHRRRPAGAGP